MEKETKIYVKEILEHLLKELDKISKLELDHVMPIERGYLPGAICCNISHTGKHIYTMNWSYINEKEREKFEEFLKGHIA